VIDPGGAVIGMWQAGPAQGLRRARRAGDAGWFELHTRAYDASIEFLQHRLRVEDPRSRSDEPEFRYTTLDLDERTAGRGDGRQRLSPEGVPSAWTVYFGVDNTDATLSEIVALGGEVVTAAEDTPYGRLATAADATGAVCSRSSRADRGGDVRG